MENIKERELAKFSSSGPGSIQVAVSKRSPYVWFPLKVSGCMLANHTSIKSMFEKIIK